MLKIQPRERKENKMKKTVMLSLIFAVALALIVLAISVNPATSTAFIPLMIGLMAVYCISQYRYSVNFR